MPNGELVVSGEAYRAAAAAPARRAGRAALDSIMVAGGSDGDGVEMADSPWMVSIALALCR
jgi:hypothetical protein